jgi:predicted DCC family thiol-disulfide oxidoreductase YuxK
MPEISKTSYSYREDANVPAFDDSKPLFVFDGVCVLCSGGASWLMRVDRKTKVNLTPAQEPLGRALYQHYGLELDDSYLLIVHGRAYSASRGYLELCRVLGGPWQFFRLAALMPEGLRDWIYAKIARNRYRWFGKTGYCTLLTAEQRAHLI